MTTVRMIKNAALSLKGACLKRNLLELKNGFYRCHPILMRRIQLVVKPQELISISFKGFRMVEKYVELLLKNVYFLMTTSVDNNFII